MQSHTALVLGATGIAGGALVRHLSDKGWRVIALSRRPLPYHHDHVTSVTADLSDKAALTHALRPYAISHVFYAAYAPSHLPYAVGSPKMMRRVLRGIGVFTPVIDRFGSLRMAFYTNFAKSSGALDPQQTNLTMLRNVVEVTTTSPHQLQHIGMVTGGKYYGMHLSPYLHRGWKMPFHEESPRAFGPNIYYDQEDYLRDVVEKMGITWTVARPAFLIGDNPRAQYSLFMGLAVYAALSKAQSMPLIFPGDAAAASCLYELTDSDLMAALLEWGALTPAAHNQAFNIVNGQPVRWNDLWEPLAALFGMKAETKPEGFNSRVFFDAHKAHWDQLVREHGLQPYSLSDLTPRDIFETAFVQGWDTVFSMDKARNLGFTRTVDHVEMFARHIQRLRDQKIIPQ